MSTLTAEEAAELVGVSRSLVYRWAEEGHLSPVRITTTDRMRFLTAEVVECAATRRSARKQARLEAMTRRWREA
ncbi:MAG: helix-turn-helix domain-containing protein [Propionibacteriaceae bacterium]|nr:helix-turn-helix domain-containing protein [Propionibacteriaceae bacterium]